MSQLDVRGLGGAQVGTQFRFVVRIDGYEIGTFTSLEGLSAEYSVTRYSEGGQNGFEHSLPGGLKYSPIRLTRALHSGSGLAAWFSKFGRSTSRTAGVSTAEITAYDANRGVVATWNLLDAYPSKWTGPSFTADGNAVVTETLELQYHGFMDVS